MTPLVADGFELRHTFPCSVRTPSMGELALGGVNQGSIATGAVPACVEGYLPRLVGGRNTRCPKHLVTVRTWSSHCISVAGAPDGSGTRKKSVAPPIAVRSERAGGPPSSPKATPVPRPARRHRARSIRLSPSARRRVRLRQVSLLRHRKRETKTRRIEPTSAGKAINLWDTTRRAPQLLFLESHVSYKRATPGAGRRS